VLLHLYKKFGPEFVKLLDGMFAFVIYQNGEYLLARDPLGIKPLYLGFGADENQMYFASEIKAFEGKVDKVKIFPQDTGTTPSQDGSVFIRSRKRSKSSMEAKPNPCRSSNPHCARQCTNECWQMSLWASA
jgi:asparagine synthetase B (glutamine-hydrolysing)